MEAAQPALRDAPPSAAALFDPSASSTAYEPSAAAQMERMLSDLGRMYRERNAALREVTRAHHDALHRLTLAAEMRDDDTGVHIVRLGYLAETLALRMGCDPHWARMLRMAAPMHDIGKIGIPDQVLKKPGSLTREEREVMNRHPQLGADILGMSRIPLFQLAAEVALSHHERWGGGGYPGGLVGEAIPLSGRIVSVVDGFDALTMDRCYRLAFSDAEALQLLMAERGRTYDPRVVDAFFDHAEELIAVRDWVNRMQPSFRDLTSDEGPVIEGPRPTAAHAAGGHA